MIRTIKNDVINRLRNRRSTLHDHSPEPLMSPTYPSDAAPDLKALIRQKQLSQVANASLTKEMEVLNMLERLEEIDPKAVKYFFEVAKKQGIYSQKSSPRVQAMNRTQQHQRSRRHQSMEDTFGDQVTPQARLKKKFLAFDLYKKDTVDQKFEYYMNQLNLEEEQAFLKRKLKASRHLTTNVAAAKSSKNEVTKEEVASPRFRQAPNQKVSLGLESLSLKNMDSGILKSSLKSPGLQVDTGKANKRVFSFQNDETGKQSHNDSRGNLQTSGDPSSNSLWQMNASQMKQDKTPLFARKMTLRQINMNDPNHGRLPQILTSQIDSSKNSFPSAKLRGDKSKKLSSQNYIYEDNQALPKKVPLYCDKLKKLPPLDDNKAFNEFFYKLCKSEIDKKLVATTSSANTSPKPKPFGDLSSMGNNTQTSQMAAPTINQYTMKNLRLSKASIKQHIMKRYGKVLTEKIMTVLESNISKPIHNVDINSYIEIVNNSIMNEYNFNNGQTTIKLHYYYKFLFQIIDFGNKGFICEHDLFQLIQALGFDRIPIYGGSTVNSIADPDYQNLDPPLDYKYYLPQAVSSIFLECFMNDYSLIVKHMENSTSGRKKPKPSTSSQWLKFNQQGNFQTKKFAKRHQMNGQLGEGDMVAELNSSSASFAQPSSKLQRKGSPMKIKEGKSRKKNILSNLITSHIHSSIEIAEAESKRQQNTQSILQNMGGTSGNYFSHNNPSKTQVKTKNKDGFIQYHELLYESQKEGCRQITFEQFLNLRFDLGVPQFIEDFLKYMTTLSLRDMVKDKVISKAQPLLRQGTKKHHQNVAIPITPRSDSALEKFFESKDQLKKIIRGFNLLSCSAIVADETLRQKVYLTKESILANFEKMFQVDNESLALRFYNVLSGGVNMKRIYLKTYLANIQQLFDSNVNNNNYFIFRVFDGSNDGVLNSNDINDIMANVLKCPFEGEVRLCSCPLFSELHSLYELYVEQNLLTYKVKKLVIDFAYFNKTVPFSCLVQEFRDKLLLNHRRPSIFSHDPKAISSLKQLNSIDQMDAKSQLEVLKKKGLILSGLDVAHNTQQLLDTFMMDITLTQKQVDTLLDQVNPTAYYEDDYEAAMEEDQSSQQFDMEVPGSGIQRYSKENLSGDGPLSALLKNQKAKNQKLK